MCFLLSSCPKEKRETDRTSPKVGSNGIRAATGYRARSQARKLLIVLLLPDRDYPIPHSFCETERDHFQSKHRQYAPRGGNAKLHAAQRRVILLTENYDLANISDLGFLDMPIQHMQPRRLLGAPTSKRSSAFRHTGTRLRTCDNCVCLV